NQSVRAALKMYARVVRADKESIPIDHCHLPPERIVSPMHGDLAVADVECLWIGRFRRVVAADVLPHGTFAEGDCRHDWWLGGGASEQNSFKRSEERRVGKEWRSGRTPDYSGQAERL